MLCHHIRFTCHQAQFKKKKPHPTFMYRIRAWNMRETCFLTRWTISHCTRWTSFRWLNISNKISMQYSVSKVSTSFPTSSRLLLISMLLFHFQSCCIGWSLPVMNYISAFQSTQLIAGCSTSAPQHRYHEALQICFPKAHDPHLSLRLFILDLASAINCCWIRILASLSFLSWVRYCRISLDDMWFAEKNFLNPSWGDFKLGKKHESHESSRWLLHVYGGRNSWLTGVSLFVVAQWRFSRELILYTKGWFPHSTSDVFLPDYLFDFDDYHIESELNRYFLHNVCPGVSLWRWLMVEWHQDPSSTKRCSL